MDATIRTWDLSKRYGERTVVDSLDLEIAPGEIFGLLGPNGAGKTTTILMLLGLVEPTGGGLGVLGHDPRRDPLLVKRRVGYVPDAVGFYDAMTGRQNLRFTARLNGIADADARIDRLLDQVGMAAAADQPVGEYSRGMKQRLGLADALVKDPALLILDEPTTAIDPEGVAEMLALIEGLAADGVTVLLSSHLLHQVQAVCHRVAIFVDGLVVAQGAPHQLGGDAGPARVEFRLGGEPATGQRVLTGMPGIGAVAPGKAPGSWEAEVDRQHLAEAVAGLVGAGVDVLGVRRVDDDLDVIYRRWFETHRQVAS